MKEKSKSNKWSIQLSKQHRDILKNHCKENGLNMSGYIEKLIEKSIPKKKILKDDDFWKTFEPKVKQRHIVYIKDEKGEVAIPSYVIKYTDRPSLNKDHSYLLTMKLYDPITPSIPQMLTKLFNNKNDLFITINVLGPVGDKVEQWNLSANIDRVDFSSLDWQDEETTSEIVIIFKINATDLEF